MDLNPPLLTWPSLCEQLGFSDLGQSSNLDLKNLGSNLKEMRNSPDRDILAELSVFFNSFLATLFEIGQVPSQLLLLNQLLVESPV